MAERRMFAKTIIDSDAFLDMPLSAQALYFHLSMRADDDGFINNPKKIQRVIGASTKDLKILEDKKFIISFSSGVVVIKHWRIHNHIQNDRYKPTSYQEEKALLTVKKNSAYTLDTDCIQNGYTLETQVSIGKVSIGKDSIGDTLLISQADRARVPVTENDVVDLIDRDFEEAWALYPKKEGKKRARDAYIKARKSGTLHAEVMDGINRYLAYIRGEKIEQRFIKQGATWFYQNCWLDDYAVHRKPTTKDLASQYSWQDWQDMHKGLRRKDNEAVSNG